jgi:hypothetical protein
MKVYLLITRVRQFHKHRAIQIQILEILFKGQIKLEIVKVITQGKIRATRKFSLFSLRKSNNKTKS